MNYLNVIAQIIFDKKGFNILALDVQGYSSLTDFLVIAEGNVDRHVVAIAKAVIDGMRELGMNPLHAEGLASGDWVVLDYLHVMVHLFMPGIREKYHLETLFPKAQIVDLDLTTESSSVK